MLSEVMVASVPAARVWSMVWCCASSTGVEMRACVVRSAGWGTTAATQFHVVHPGVATTHFVSSYI